MELILPDWVPNMHPMVVHFPIALLIVAVLADILALILRTRVALARLSTGLFVIGALALLFAWLSGRAAADSVVVSGAANAVLTDHSDWATILLWYYGIYALVRLVLWRLRFPTVIWVPLAVIGAGGLWLMVQSSHLGARLVFEQGVGVAKVSQLESEVSALEQELIQLRGASSAPVVQSDGSWSWTPDAFGKEAFEQEFNVVAGQVDIETYLDSTSGAHYLALTPVDSVALMVFESPIASVEFEAAMDISKYDGLVRIVHHVVGPAQYDYMELADGQVRLGRLGENSQQVYDEQPFTAVGMSEFRVVSDRTHFRAYVNNTMVAHGHGSEAATGPVGIMLQGTGTLLVGPMRAESIR